MIRISLNLEDFKKLTRGEIVTQGEGQAALQDVGFQAMSDAVDDAILAAGWEIRTHYSLATDDVEVRRWIHGINQHEPSRPGDFLLAFSAAVCRADDSNYTLLRPALIALKAKFPQYRFTGAMKISNGEAHSL